MLIPLGVFLPQIQLISNLFLFQFEQKKFLQQHKIRADSYSKAAATMKKQRKKKATSQNADKEIKVDNLIFMKRRKKCEIYFPVYLLNQTQFIELRFTYWKSVC